MKIKFALTFVLSIALFSGCTKKNQDANNAAPAASSPRVLNLYCWSNYFSPEMIKRFEQKANARVVFSYFSSNEELLAKLQAGARGYDVIVPTGYLVKALKELGLIENLGNLDWPELKGLTARFQGPAFDPKHEYTVPYAWGTTGMAVNKAKVKAPVDSWAWLFDHPELKGQVSMLDDAPAAFGAALKYLGYAYNESSPEAFAKVKALLVKQKKWLKAYAAESQPLLESGEVAIAMAYSGDVIQVQKRKNPNIEYVLPKEGGEIFADSLAIPKGAPSIELAKEFMRFTLQQEIAAIQVQHLFYSPVVDLKGTPAYQALSGITAVFPSDEALKKFEMMVENPERVEKIQQLWTELKSI